MDATSTRKPSNGLNGQAIHLPTMTPKITLEDSSHRGQVEEVLETLLSECRTLRRSCEAAFSGDYEEAVRLLR